MPERRSHNAPETTKRKRSDEMITTLDRYARIEHVRRGVEAAQKIYALLGHPEALRFETPLVIHRLARQ